MSWSQRLIKKRERYGTLWKSVEKISVYMDEFSTIWALGSVNSIKDSYRSSCYKYYDKGFAAVPWLEETKSFISTYILVDNTITTVVPVVICLLWTH